MGHPSMGDIGKSESIEDASFKEFIQETQAEAERDIEVEGENKSGPSDERFDVLAQENSAMAYVIKQEKLPKREEIKAEKARQAQESVLVRKEDADSLAGDFSRRQGNKEYHLDPLLLSLLAAAELGEGINQESTSDEVIAIIRKRLTAQGQAPDVAMVDKAFEFLLEVAQFQLQSISEADKPRLKAIHDRIEIAKDKHYAAHAVEIQVAQKIIGAVDAVVEATGETVQSTLTRYRDIVHNPPELQTLRKSYEARWGANWYMPMIRELNGLNTYLGANLKRTNLENPELAQLNSAARKMQALLGVPRQTKVHSKTMESYLELHGILGAKVP